MNIQMTNNFMKEANELDLSQTSDFAAIALKLSEIKDKDESELKSYKVRDTLNDVYVIKHKSYRIFFTKNDNGLIVLSITRF
ncbi:hypothetical protein WKH29_02685 [Pantoea agglomerans]|uniref:hypothetical protein n=1 Tax=Enterobacter agglomerans TaxID=549 RepID=UPI0028E811D6|nr:hypothetical protein [uncultured Pantoea sp.]